MKENDILRQLSFGVKRTKPKVVSTSNGDSDLRLRVLPEKLVEELKEIQNLRASAKDSPVVNVPVPAKTSSSLSLFHGIELNDDEMKKGSSTVTIDSLTKRYNEKIAQLKRLNRIFTWGSDIADPFIDFGDLGLPDTVLNSLKEFGIETPTPIQMQAIPLMTQKRDLLCSAPTGSGKTLGFVLPSILEILKLKKAKPLFQKEKKLLILVLEPTRELALQTYRQFLKFGSDLGINYAIFDSNSVPSDAEVIVSTPNRIVHNLDSLNLKSLRWLVVDESDRLFEVVEGEDRSFRQQLASVYKSCDGKFIRRAFFSATFSYEVEEWCKENLNNVAMICIGMRNSSNTNVEQQLVYAGSEHGKVIALRDLFQANFDPPVLIFVQSKLRARELKAAISAFQPPISCDFISSERSQKDRDNTMDKFREGKIWVLICTELMGRGLDFKNVNLVVNFDLPTSIVSYIHRVGRTGRAGKTGKAVTYFTEGDLKHLRPIATVIHQAGFTVPEYTLSLKKPTRNEKHDLLQHAVRRKHISRLVKKSNKHRKGAKKTDKAKPVEVGGVKKTIKKNALLKKEPKKTVSKKLTKKKAET